MKKSIDRYHHINNLFKKHNINYEFVDAIDGKLDNIEKMCAIKHTKGTGIDKNFLSDCILATTISHFKAIKTFAEDKTNNDDYAIIVEDDVDFDFCKYWGDSSFNDIIKRAPIDWEILQLVYGKANSTSDRLKPRFEFARGYGFFATAYLIKRKIALEYSNKFFKNNILQNNIGIDHMKYIADYFIYEHAKTYTHIPSLLTYREKNDSYLHPTHISLHVSLKQENKTIWESKNKTDKSPTIKTDKSPITSFPPIVAPSRAPIVQPQNYKPHNNKN